MDRIEPTIQGNLLDVAPEWTSQVQQSMNWIRQWYAGRVDHDYDPLIEASSFDWKDYQAAMQKLDHVWLCAEPGGIAFLEKAMQEGRLRLEAPVSVLEDYGLRSDGTVIDRDRFEAAFALDERTGGVTIPIFQDPVIILHVDQIKQDQQHGMPVYVEDLLVHELTHGLCLHHAEMMAGLGSANQDAYWDSGVEVYARLNELRAHFGLDPTKQITADDVARLRRQYKGEMADFLQHRSELDPSGSYARGGMELKLHDQLPRVFSASDLFNQYTDQELVRLLNSVTQRRPLDDLDREHSRESLLSNDRLAMQSDRQTARMCMNDHRIGQERETGQYTATRGYRI